jgi:hypothetical protein
MGEDKEPPAVLDRDHTLKSFEGLEKFRAGDLLKHEKASRKKAETRLESHSESAREEAPVSPSPLSPSQHNSPSSGPHSAPTDANPRVTARVACFYDS